MSDTATPVASSDIIAALIGLSGQKFIEADPQRLHRAIRTSRTLSPLLERFRFSYRSPTPLSREVDDALGILKLGRLIRLENTDYDRYIVSQEAVSYISENILPKFSAEELSGLERAAAVFREVCGADLT